MIGKKGKDKETKWAVKRVGKESHVSTVSDVPDVDFDAPEFSGDVEVNPDNNLPF